MSGQNLKARMSNRAFHGLAAATVLLAAGCGAKSVSPGPPAFPVHGKVIYKGKSAAGFRVVLHPLTQQSGPSFAPSAITDEKGEFRLGSYQDGDGAPEGEYAVTFEWPQAVPGPDPGDAPQQVDRLGGKWNHPEASRFKVKVAPGENELKPFELESSSTPQR